MPKVGVETTLRIRLPHRAGQLARVCTSIAAEDGIIGDVTTVRVGENESVRDLVIETSDGEHAARVTAAIAKLDGIEVMGSADVVFERHRGGKIQVTSRVEIRG